MKKKQAKNMFKIVLIVGSLVSLWFVPWIVVKAWVLPLPDTIQEQANEAVENGFAGILIYVDKANEPAEFYAAGWHNKKKKIPANPHAFFKIGSINKLYTAVAIAKLVNAGQLSLDKTLADYLPELSGRIENANKITLKMMVQHRSGIPNYTDTKDYWAHPKENNKEKLALVLDHPADFEPGKKYEYCNTNYLLLSEIMDRVLGYPHFEFIQKEILDRLDLKNTFPSVRQVNMDKMMSGYHKGHPFDLKTDDIGMVATAEDVGIFLRALNDGSLFDGEEKKIYSSIYKYEHKGWVPGYQSIAEYHKDIDAVVVQFTSTTDPKLYYWNLADVEYSRVIKIIKRNSHR
ncbi:beta-lactamase family protein [Aequorivita sp. F47161]|uniref:Beta-lactamase family protein n=1 Tax=Aequorivita vitellina TaxID=2874475 RepID=A0A9X1U218_9FLAO|nr:serine hydrolase domain-containing protein [Aequorivita vitellina]MCG2417812.1 beta-lactamase family protein [Aequorivita vitellina]